MEKAAQVVTQQSRFTLQWEGDAEAGVPVALDVMLEANQDDPELCAWLHTAEIGAEYKNGGGAAPACTTRRIS